MRIAWLANWKERNTNLLLVNKFLNREAGRIFWRKNEFRFHEWADFTHCDPRTQFVAGRQDRTNTILARDIWSPIRYKKIQALRRVSVIRTGATMLNIVLHMPNAWSERCITQAR